MRRLTLDKFTGRRPLGVEVETTLRAPVMQEDGLDGNVTWRAQSRAADGCAEDRRLWRNQELGKRLDSPAGTDLQFLLRVSGRRGRKKP